MAKLANQSTPTIRWKLPFRLANCLDDDYGEFENCSIVNSCDYQLLITSFILHLDKDTAATFVDGFLTCFILIQGAVCEISYLHIHPVL